jgi:hypothetical protein
MTSDENDELFDRTAEERSEGEGMTARSSNAPGPKRSTEVPQMRASRPKKEHRQISTTGLGVATASFVILAVVAAARSARRWLQHKNGAGRSPS